MSWDRVQKHGKSIRQEAGAIFAGHLYGVKTSALGMLFNEQWRTCPVC